MRPSWAPLLNILDGKARLLLSTTRMIEYEAVLTRSENLTRFGIGVADVLGVLDDLTAGAAPFGIAVVRPNDVLRRLRT